MAEFKYFKNLTPTSADFYVYGDIVDNSTDWWTGEKDAFNVDPLDLKDELDELQGIKELNIYINSGGGSVFASSTMVSILKRFREQSNAVINACVDGLCASAATYLLMVADKINIYNNSIVMIHKPMTYSIGNADQLQKDIETLNSIENDMMIPMYMSKASVSEEEIRAFVNQETWFNGNPESDMYLGNYFNVNYIEEASQAVACSSVLLNKYANTPKVLMQPKKAVEEEPKQQYADNSLYQNRLTLLNLKEV